MLNNLTTFKYSFTISNGFELKIYTKRKWKLTAGRFKIFLRLTKGNWEQNKSLLTKNDFL